MRIACKICGRRHKAKKLASPECLKCGNPLDVPEGVPIAKPTDADEEVPQEAGPDDAAVFYTLAGMAIAVVFTALLAIGAFWLLFDTSKVSGQSTDRGDGPWAVFHQPNHYFAASFPDAPTYETETLATQDGPLDGHVYSVNSLQDGSDPENGDDSYQYTVAYYRMPSGEFSGIRPIDEATVLEQVSVKNYETSREQFAGLPSIKVVGENDDGKACEIYLFQAQQCWYSVSAVGGTPADRSRFFDSVEVRPSRRIDPHKDEMDRSFARRWKPHLSAHGRFRCEFPQLAVEQDGWRDQEAAHAYIGHDDDTGGVFTVFYRELSEGEAADPNAIVEEVLESIRFSGEQSEAEQIAVDGLVGRQVEWRGDGDRISIVRLFVAEQRLYGLLAEATGPAKARYFYKKFTLLPAETAAEADPSDPESPGKPAPAASANADFLNDPFVRRLTSSDRRQVDAAFRELAQVQPDPARWTIVKALEIVMLKSSKYSHRRKAVQALDEWANVESVPSLIRVLDDDSSFIVRDAMMVLGRFPTPQALNALTAKFAESRYRHYAGKALVMAGPAAIPYILKVSRRSSDDFQRSAACDLLAEIGTWKARNALRSMLNDSSFHVRSRAKSALEKLDARSGQGRVHGYGH